ncbi:MAG: hypothetical protein WD534_01895 [Phycisphaeraceae bacterium]
MATDEATLAPEVTVWADTAGAGAASAVLDRMGSAVRPIGVGGPRVTAVDQLARTLGCAREDDLRKMLVDRPAAFLLLATMRQASVEDVLTAVRQGTLVLALEPVAEELRELSAIGSGGGRPTGDAEAGPAGRIVAAPAFDQSPGYLSAAEPGEALGEPRTIRYESLGQAGEGSLYARLLDGWRTVLEFSSLPMTVDASLAGAVAESPESLRDLAGALTAHGRMNDGSSAVLHVADRAGESRRALCVLGGEGQLRVDDVSYGLWQTTGELLDDARPETGASFADLVSWQWRRLIDRLDGVLPEPASPRREAEALACCLASLLSIRTGQPESPAKLVQMGR